MPVSVEQAAEGFRFVIIEAQDWFREQTGDERDEAIFFWYWIGKAPPRVGKLSGIVEEEFHRILAEWFAKFRAATAVYLKAKALAIKGAPGSFDVGYGLTLEIENNARRLAPPFLAHRQAAGYYYAAEYFEMLIEKLEAWTVSNAGYGGSLPFSEFWAWFETTSVHGKFMKLEAEIEELFAVETGPDDKRRIEELSRNWDESLRWAVTEFHEKSSQNVPKMCQTKSKNNTSHQSL